MIEWLLLLLGISTVGRLNGGEVSMTFNKKKQAWVACDEDSDHLICHCWLTSHEIRQSVQPEQLHEFLLAMKDHNNEVVFK